jgi:hypothetical protein
MVKKVLTYSLLTYATVFVTLLISLLAYSRLTLLKDPEFVDLELIFIISLAAVFFIGMFIGVLICTIVRRPQWEWRIYLAAQILLFLPVCRYIIDGLVPDYILYPLLRLFVQGF